MYRLRIDFLVAGSNFNDTTPFYSFVSTFQGLTIFINPRSTLHTKPNFYVPNKKNEIIVYEIDFCRYLTLKVHHAVKRHLEEL
jgi:hypothetical protein